MVRVRNAALIPHEGNIMENQMNSQEIAPVQTHLTPRQLAERWQVSDATLASWRYKGCGPKYIKWGKVIRYPVTKIEEWEREHEKTNTAQ